MAYLVVDIRTTDVEMKDVIDNVDKDDAELGLVLIIDLVGRPKAQITTYRNGNWESINTL